MIIDSHAHYNNNCYKKPFRYLTRNEGGYALAEGEREWLFRELLDAGILYSIEPGVSLQSCEEVLKLASENSGRIFPAMGIHPTRSIYEKWSDRKKLDVFAKTPDVIAIGECGLDYHYKREEQHRLKQHIWFLYQLNLAWKMKLPVILHVRDAHEDALRILKWHPARKLGGVVHCFYGSWKIAEQYLNQRICWKRLNISLWIEYLLKQMHRLSCLLSLNLFPNVSHFDRLSTEKRTKMEPFVDLSVDLQNQKTPKS